MTDKLYDLTAFKRIGGGKTKDVYAQSDASSAVLIRSRDDITAGNGIRHNKMTGKAKLSTTTTVNNFTYLEDQNIPTHLLHRIDSVTFEAVRCTPIPIECVARRYAAGGSFRRRVTWIPRNHRFEEPVIELFWKDDEYGDPYMEWDNKFELFRLHAAKVPTSLDSLYRVLNPSEIVGLEAYDGNSYDLFGEINYLTEDAFRHLEDAYARVGLTIVDFKIEFGVDANGRLRIIDVIDADSWRAWVNGDPGRPVDKEFFRQNPEEPPDTSLPAYRLVAEKSSEILRGL